MTMSELRNHEVSKQSELVVVEERSARGLKGSLISEVSSRDRDTVYSYFEQDETLDHERQGSSRVLRGSRRDLRKSLRNTKHDLSRVKDLLKKERQVNREQVDLLKKMQAEIEALTQRWQMTEERLKSGEAMYNILSRTTSNLGGHLSRSPLAPLPLKGNASSNFLVKPRDSIDTGAKHHFLSHNNLLATNTSSNHVTPPEKVVVLD